ncbi:MerR family transcriptional regulator [Corynebacterium phocae]|nr:MerR family transcriptional regulator [Corynebacterium phocae]
MSIGVVFDLLKLQFEDVSLSKIRYLETEGLVSPSRTPAGYRRFTEADVDRLRFILTSQRDNYTPLKVIREQLQAMDSGQVTAIVGAGQADTLVKADQFRTPAVARLTDQDVAEQSGATAEDVAAFTALGIITPDPSGFYTTDDVAVTSAAAALKAFGLNDRQLKTLRNNASRHADLISQVAAPVKLSKSDTAAAQAEELSQQMAALVVSLHGMLVKTDLRREFKA